MDDDGLCDYGCKQPAMYQLGNKKCCCNNWRKCPEVRRKNSISLKIAYTENRAGYSYSNLPDDVKKKMSREDHWNNLPWDQIKDNFYKRKRLIKEDGHCCQKCRNSTWQDKPIPLEVEHKDGNNNNWERSNVWMLCPNCHALTDTYRGKNKNNGRIIVDDNDLINTIKTSKNIRQVLLLSKLTPKASNYERIRTLIFTNNLNFKQ